ncbi:hypothetical protein [Halobellus ruber]|uniref:Uncharacterized protein n=1 Tax=Halobellus ruber TaxID=2761102 RepID=A0A7J9SPA1_9EURY|nr:hypothetical protein [Halobellus ruber]MBB6647171.1 hypothetical protein [Halobellus ruber]
MLQTLRPADAALRRPAPLTLRSIAATTGLLLAIAGVVAIVSSLGV